MEGYRVMKAEDAASLLPMGHRTGDCNQRVDEPAFKNMKRRRHHLQLRPFRLRDQHEGLRANAVKVEGAEAFGGGVHVARDGRTITVLAEGRFVNLAVPRASGLGYGHELRQPGARRRVPLQARPSLSVRSTTPAAIDDDVARVKLETLGIEIDTLTEEQIAYMNSWNF